MSRLQLFCFTYAGGTSSFLDEIENDLPEIDFVKLEYAGHGARHKEPLYQNFDELADDIFPRVKEAYRGEEYALFGYSMGTITLAEVLKRIVADGKMALPKRVFLVAHEPQTWGYLDDLSDAEVAEWVKQRTLKFGAVPERLINNKTYWRVYLPLYTADYSIIGKYKFEDLNLHVSIPVTAFYSEQDVPLAKMEKWKKYFTGEFETQCFEGTHFFIQQHHAEMAEIIRSNMSVKEQ